MCKLDWVIKGNVNQNKKKNTSSKNAFSTFSNNEHSLENILPNFWKLE